MKFIEQSWKKRIEEKTGQSFNMACPICKSVSFGVLPGGVIQIIGDPGEAAMRARLGHGFPHIMMLGMVCNVCGYVHFFDASIACEQETPEELKELEKQVKEEENRIAIVSEGQAQQLLDRIKGGKK